MKLLNRRLNRYKMKFNRPLKRLKLGKRAHRLSKNSYLIKDEMYDGY